MSLVTRKMQIKTIMRYHLTPARMAIINKSTKNKCWQGCGEKGSLVHCWQEMQIGGKQYGGSSKKLKMDLLYDPAILLLGIYLKKPKTLIQKNMCTPMFTAALFTIAKI